MELPISARLAWWGTAALRGHLAVEQAEISILGADAAHTFIGLHADTVDVAGLLGYLVERGCRTIGMALPAEGSPLGLGGPAEFNTLALAQHEAAVCADAKLGLVPFGVGAGVQWRVVPAHPRMLPDVGEADRVLRRTLVQAGEQLAALEVAKWRPEVADELMDLRQSEIPHPPRGTPPRCVELAGRALGAIAIADVALADDGASVSAAEMSARVAAIRPLRDAGRQGLVAACSPEVWPPS